TRRFGGTGLGLAICAQLTKLMGGSIRAEGRLDGPGSAFHFSVTVGIHSCEIEPVAVPESAILRGRSALVIDDNATSRRLFEDMLREWRMIPELAGSGPDGLEMMARAARSGQPFDVVLLDASMPGMDGFAVV